MSATADSDNHTAQTEPPDAARRIAEVLDSVLMHAGPSLADEENRTKFAAFVMGLFRRAEGVPAERAVEIVLRSIVTCVIGVAERVFEEFDAEALAAIGRGE